MGVGALAMKQLGFMFVWYGLLWAVIEACIDPREGRSVDLRGPFMSDIDKLAPALRECRNAILHVPRSGALLDARIVRLVSEPSSASMIRRVSRGFARLKRLRATLPAGVQPARRVEGPEKLTHTKVTPIFAQFRKPHLQVFCYQSEAK